MLVCKVFLCKVHVSNRILDESPQITVVMSATIFGNLQALPSPWHTASQQLHHVQASFH
jgi:hypothetical protein